jgi:hypothetical protein
MRIAARTSQHGSGRSAMWTLSASHASMYTSHRLCPLGKSNVGLGLGRARILISINIGPNITHHSSTIGHVALGVTYLVYFISVA